MNITDPLLLPLSRTLRFRDTNIEGIDLVTAPTDFDGVLIPDHIPLMANDRRVGMAYTVGYIKALLERANQEIAAI